MDRAKDNKSATSDEPSTKVPKKPPASQESSAPSSPKKPQSFAVGLLRLMGVEYWMVSWTPLWVGWFIAGKEAVPDLPAFLLLVAAGPLLTGSTFVFNNLVDREADLGNPRKAFSLLVQGRLSLKAARVFYISLVGATLVVGGLSGLRLAARESLEPVAWLSACLLLSLAYSWPRTGLKHRGGADLLTNVFGFGVFLPLAGWSLVEPSLEFPLLYLAAIAFTLGALYAPTTVADFHADRVVATHSLAVRFGIGPALKLGFFLLLAGVSCIFILGVTTSYPFYDIRLIQVCGWYLPLQLAAYYRYFWSPADGSVPKWEQMWKGSIVVGSLAALSNLTFVLLFLWWL